ncbi:MAG TPA: hypothetical protein VFH03_23090, partial [Actinoplanes sp.]|nr:hypothetical protein [Actinoplanes sp.]
MSFEDDEYWDEEYSDNSAVARDRYSARRASSGEAHSPARRPAAGDPLPGARRPAAADPSPGARRPAAGDPVSGARRRGGPEPLPPRRPQSSIGQVRTSTWDGEINDPVIDLDRGQPADELAARRKKRSRANSRGTGTPPATPGPARGDFDTARPGWLDDPDFVPTDTSQPLPDSEIVDFNRPEFGADFDNPEFPGSGAAARRRRPGPPHHNDDFDYLDPSYDDAAYAADMARFGGDPTPQLGFDRYDGYDHQGFDDPADDAYSDSGFGDSRFDDSGFRGPGLRGSGFRGPGFGESPGGSHVDGSGRYAGGPPDRRDRRSGPDPRDGRERDRSARPDQRNRVAGPRPDQRDRTAGPRPDQSDRVAGPRPDQRDRIAGPPPDERDHRVATPWPDERGRPAGPRRDHRERVAELRPDPSGEWVTGRADERSPRRADPAPDGGRPVWAGPGRAAPDGVIDGEWAEGPHVDGWPEDENGPIRRRGNRRVSGVPQDSGLGAPDPAGRSAARDGVAGREAIQPTSPATGRARVPAPAGDDVLDIYRPRRDADRRAPAPADDRNRPAAVAGTPSRDAGTERPDPGHATPARADAGQALIRPGA